MANYIITKADGTTITVNQQTVNSNFSVGFIGQNYVGFGTELNQGILRTLECFANDTPPERAVRGQLWFHMPSGNVSGNTGVLKVWTGADPTDLGYSYPSTDSGNVSLIANWKQAGVQGITDTDIGTNLNPFDNIYVTNAFVTNGEFETLFVGDSNTSDGTTLDKDYFTPVPDSTNDTTGVRIGKTTNRFREVHTRTAIAHNKIKLGDISGNYHASLVADNVATNTIIPGDSQTVRLGSSASLAKRFDQVNAANVNSLTLSLLDGVGEGINTNLVPVTDNTSYIGANTRRFHTAYANNVNAAQYQRKDASSTVGTNPNPFLAMYAVTFYGTATQANYADLAERYESDALYPVGTLVKVGGEKEVTATTEFGDDFIGVTSEKPAFLMNKDAGPDETHPAIALTGRIPVRVIGKVKKGQRLITSQTPGVACANNNTSPYVVTCFIGYALKDKDTEEEGLVEVVIGAK